MTTMDGNPSVARFLLWKLGKAMSAKVDAREKVGTRARTWVQSTIRLVLHIAGFGCLTLAGFSWTITAGLIVAGLSFFVMSYLATSSTRTEPPTANPMR